MSRQKRWLLVPIAVILLMGAIITIYLVRGKEPKKPQQLLIGDHTYTRALAEHRLQEVMDKFHIPGSAMALVVDQEIIWQGSYGLANIELERPVTEDTIFKLWSLAKPFTAVEIMRLVEEGMVDLDSPISEYLPGISIQSRFPDGELVTIRHLLGHRSGLPRNGCVQPDWHYGADAGEKMITSLEYCFLVSPTGERYKYSNVGFDALGYIVQAKREKPFPVYMHEHLLVPLGMLDSSFWSTELFGVGQLDASRLAVGYEFYEGHQYAYQQNDIAKIPSGNLYGTTGDLANFIRFIFRDGESEAGQIMNPEILNAMFEDQYSRPADPQRIGLGWKISRIAGSETMVWHDGGPSEGIGSLVTFLPERKLGLVLLANSTSFDGGLSTQLAAELLEVMLETEYGMTVTEEEPTAAFPVAASVLAEYEGNYAAFGETMEVFLKGDQLKGSIQGMSFDLVPSDENRFRVNHWLYKLGLADLLRLPIDLRELEIEFQEAEENSQDVMIINMGGISYEICPRYPEPAENLEVWEAVVGKYGRYSRLASGGTSQDLLGETEISLVDGRLRMSGPVGLIAPIAQDTIVIYGGAYAGETIEHDPDSGFLFHQGYVYKPTQ